jgi:hypothetical protein
MMTIDLGGDLRGSSASREVSTRWPSTGTSGKRRGLQPVDEQHVFRFEELPFVLALGDLDHAGDGHLGAADEVIDLVLAKEKLDALGHLPGDAARAVHDLGEIETDLLCRDAERFGLLQRAVKLGALEQRLGRNAAPVQAGAAGALELDARDFLAELTGANGTRIARRATADDDEIVFRSFSHSPSKTVWSTESRV